MIETIKFRWKFGKVYHWPWRRRLAWILFGGGRYISNGVRVR